MNRISAEKELKRIFGFENFYDKQWETIERIFLVKGFCLLKKQVLENHYAINSLQHSLMV